MSRTFTPWLWGLLLGPTACSLVVGADVTRCQSTSDCAARGAAFANTVCVASECVASETTSGQVEGWDCLGKLAPIRTDASRAVRLNLRLTDLRSAGRSGLRVNYCYTLDPSCSPLLADDVLSDADGKLSLSVPYGMKGALIITGGSELPDPSATQTGSNGVGGFANVPPGLLVINATLADGDLAIGQGNFLVRENWLTYATISPYDH